MGKARTAPSIAVVDYDAGWDINTNLGSIRIELQRGQPFILQRIETHVEFIAILTLLQGEKTVFFKRPGILTTVS